MEKYLTLLACLLLAAFAICCFIYAVRYVAAKDLTYFCRYQVDRFPIESVYLLTKKDVETFRFMFSERVATGQDQLAIRNAIVKLKGPRGDILKKAYDFAVYQC
jgi:hypothetical protein